jgi:MinD superfamily P-loop ATPase
VREIAVISGKGGTGKTSLTAAFVQLSPRCLAVDADVDAANLALLLPGEDGPRRAFLEGRRAVIDPRRCSVCGACSEVCRFGAIRRTSHGFESDPLHCEGCGACAQVCAEGAVGFRENQAGVWRVRTTSWGSLIHARLAVAQGNSGKLVAHLRREAKELAQRQGDQLLLLDGPPGIGCAVHATITGVDYVVVVTEPTESGAHDLARALDLVAQFDIPAGVILNKADLNPEGADLVEQAARARGVPMLGRVPFDPRLPRALAAAQTGLEIEGTREPIQAAWDTLCRRVWGKEQGDDEMAVPRQPDCREACGTCQPEGMARHRRQP